MHPIDNIFKDHLANCEVAPSSAMWSRIEQSLNESSAKKKVIVWHSWLWAASLALVVGLGSVLISILPKHQLVSSIAMSGDINNNITKQSDNPILEDGKLSTDNSSIEIVNENLTAYVEPSLINNVVVSDNSGLPYNSNNKSVLSFMESKSYDFAEVSVDVPVFTNVKASPIYLPFPELPNNKDLDIADVKSNNDNWMVGGVITPSHVYRTVSTSGYMPTSANESSMGALNAGLKVKRNRGKRWAIETGIGFERVGQVVTPSNNLAFNSFDPNNSFLYSSANGSQSRISNSLGNIDQRTLKGDNYNGKLLGDYSNVSGVFQNGNIISISEVVEMKQVLDYIEIPLVGRYYFVKKKGHALSVSTGLSANFLVGTSATISYANGASEEGEIERINDVAYGTQLGFGLDVPLFKSLSLSLEPIFKYFLTPANNSSDTDYRPYSLGFNAGVNYRF